MKTSTKDTRWVGKPVVDVNGDPVGTLHATAGGDEWPELVLVALGQDGAGGFGRRVVALPADDARIEKRAVRLSMLRSEAEAGREVDGDAKKLDDADADTVLSDDGSVTMIRSEEELVPRAVTRVAERAVARKVVVEEEVTLTVTLRREDVQIERVPIPEGEKVKGVRDEYFESPDDDGAEFVLYGEQPVVTKRVVPMERVRVGKETVVEDVPVTGEVQVERVEVVGTGEAVTGTRERDVATERDGVRDDYPTEA